MKSDSRDSRAQMERLVQFLAKTEGRDKATKLAQYSLRFLAWTASGNKETAAHMNALSRASGEARQIFRLGKFIPESMALLKACETEPSEEKEKRRIWRLQVASRAFFTAYWLLDALLLLAKLKVLRRDPKSLSRKCGLLW